MTFWPFSSSSDTRRCQFTKYNEVLSVHGIDLLFNTASEEGFRIFLWWQVEFTDGTTQTYLAVVHLEGDECEEHGWDDHPNDDTTCVDLDA